MAATVGTQIFADDERGRRVRTVGTHVAPGTAILLANEGPAVTFTGSGDFVKTDDIDFGNGDVWSFEKTGGGTGLADHDATVTFTGSWAFPVVGATVTAAYDTDGNGKPVYIMADGTLTLTASQGTAPVVNNPKFGVVDFFRGNTTTDTVVKIGA